MPRGIAIDWVAGNVYWTDSGRDVIEVAQMKGENRKTLISGMIDEPHAIVVDPLRGWAGLGGGVWAGGGPAPQVHSFLPSPAWAVFLGLRSSHLPLAGPPLSLQPRTPTGLLSRGLTATGLLSWAARVWAAPRPQGRALPAWLTWISTLWF